MIIINSIIYIFLTVNLFYWIIVFSRFSRHKNNKKEKENNKIEDSAILVSIKDEEQNIKKNFKFFLEQKPDKFDFIIVDDYSKDNSKEILNQPPFLGKIIVLENKSNPGKKQALSYAISQTDKEYLLLTDADCYVKSESWVKKMINSFDENTSIVLGYSPYTGNSLLGKFIRFETFMAALQYFSYYLIGIPYMGVGRNMAIRRSFFIKNDGYKTHLDIKSGNDDLFVNENANSENTRIQIDPDTFVYSTPPKTLIEFIKQKTRHISTSFRYKKIHKLMLGFYSLSHIGFYIALILSFVFMPFYIGIIFWILRIIILYISSYSSFNKLKEQDLLVFLPVLDFLMFIYYTYLGIYYFFAPKNKW